MVEANFRFDPYYVCMIARFFARKERLAAMFIGIAVAAIVIVIA
jgi:hypothetical protein